MAALLKVTADFPFPAPRPGFARQLNGDASLIESRCEQCGAVIVGSVLHGLAEKEGQHLADCQAKAVAISQSPVAK